MPERSWGGEAWRKAPGHQENPSQPVGLSALVVLLKVGRWTVGICSALNLALLVFLSANDKPGNSIDSSFRKTA